MNIKYFSYCIIALTLLFTLSWCEISVPQATFLGWLVSFITIYYCFKGRKKGMLRLEKWDNGLLNLYLFWLFFNIIRGAYIAEGYWEWKALIGTSITLLLPVVLYVFADADRLRKTLGAWFRWIIPLFFLFLIWLFNSGAYHYCLAPIFVFGIFTPIIPKRIRWLFITVLIVSVFIRFYDARSQVIKAAVGVLFAIAFFCRRYITSGMIKLGYLVCYVVPVVLLYLGISGTYNVFENVSEDEEGKYTSERMVNGELVENDLSSDTRTFIYQEVITSAVRHNYVIWGRTPARGNDSEAFGSFTAEELGTGKYERGGNELCHPNVFTWLGLIGMTMYSLFYMRSSWLCLFRSRSRCMKFVGLFVAFHWAYGWVEDMVRFQIDNLALWMMIAMGLSKQFRAMTDKEFIAWIRGIFGVRRRRVVLPYPTQPKQVEQSQLQTNNT